MGGSPGGPRVGKPGAICAFSTERRYIALRGLALSMRALAEVGAAADAFVVPGPLGAVWKLFLEAVEAAEPAAEVVDHVPQRRLAGAWGHPAALLERALVAEDDVPQLPPEPDR